jgi:hypothetical protein
VTSSKLSKEWKTILRFSLAGFFLGIVGGAGTLVPNLDSRLVAISVIVCPASLLAIPFSVWLFEAAEVGTAGFYVLLTAIAVANAIVYSFIGAICVGLRKKPDKPATYGSHSESA